MRIHHLNCGTMRMPGADLVCHVLLLESEHGLILVDTGFGLADIADPAHRIGPYRAVIRPALVEEQTAIRQVQALGFRPEDVRDIILTHGDSDHAGGLSDFPWARVHVSEQERWAIQHRPTWFERQRYNTKQWRHHPHLHGHAQGTLQWNGFSGVTSLDEVAQGLLLVPLPGHSRGHTAVAVDAGSHWILHAGDAFYHPGTIDGSSAGPLSLRLQEAGFAFDNVALRRSQQKLGGLLRAGGEKPVEIVNSHSRALFLRDRVERHHELDQ